MFNFLQKLFGNGDRGTWMKVSNLAVGAEIAVPSESGAIFWDEIVSIMPVGRERVFDVEVEGTHNFIGNDIFAHNTAFVVQQGSNNVGVGTTTPTLGLLDVNGNVAIENQGQLRLYGPRSTGNIYYASLSASSTMASTVNWTLPNADGTSGQVLATNGVGNMYWTTGTIPAGTTGQFPYYSDTNTLSATSSLFLATSGNVGIGTTTPVAALDVNGSMRSVGSGSPSSGSGVEVAYAGGTGYLIAYNRTSPAYLPIKLRGSTVTLGSGSNDHLTVDTTGNVGIGTTTPNRQLDIAKTGGYARMTLRRTDNANGNALGQYEFNGLTDTGADINYGTIVGYSDDIANASKDSKMTFYTYSNNVETLTLSLVSGSVGIGTLSPNQGKVEVKGGTVCVDTDSDDNASSCIANESDARLKTNIQTMLASTSLATILALRPVSFDWRASDPEVLSHYSLLGRFASSPHSIGLIAQEVQLVLPEAIGTETVGDAEVQYYQLDYTKFIPPLIGAVQELNGKFMVPADANASTTPSFVLTADGKAIDLYKLATYTTTNVQEFAARVDGLETRMTSLEERVAALENGSVSTASGSPISLSTTSLASALNAFGAFIQKGIAQFGTLVADQFVAATNSVGDSSAGTVTILAGNTVALVQNAYVLPTSKIFVTLTASTTGSWYISDKQAGSFKLVLEAAQTADVSFDYFLIQTEGQIATSSPMTNGQTPMTNGNTKDTEAPVITVLGDNPLYLSVGGVFTEPGVTVTDNSGVTPTIVTYVNGIQQEASAATISTSAEMTYIITYSATDAAGNLATARRSVIIGAPSEIIVPDTSGGTSTTTESTTEPSADTTPPAVSDVEPPVVTLQGDAVMEFAAATSTPFVDPGATATDDVDGDLTASIVLTGAVDPTTAGLYTLTYTATDAAGNSGSASRAVTVIAVP